MLRSLRHLRAGALALPLVTTIGCSSTSTTKDAEQSKPQTPTRYRDAAGQCWETPFYDCGEPSEGITCNPPPSHTIDCPADLKTLTYDNYKEPEPIPPG